MEILRKLLDIAETGDWHLFLVGGAVRDLLSGYGFKDLDLIVTGGDFHNRPVMELARRVADALGGSYVPLDEERGVARVVLAEGEPGSIDLAGLQGETLEEDLGRRDFTVNAIALPLNKEIISGLRMPDLNLASRVIDPRGGLKDIRSGVVRAMGEAALVEDPVRMLRAVRIAARNNWRIEAETAGFIRKHARLITKPARERLGEEFFRLLRQPDAARWIGYMVNELQLLQPLWPEIARLQETEQNCHHVVNAWTHCLTALEELEGLLADSDYFPPDLQGVIASHSRQVLVRGKSTRGILWKFTALFHDVGKSLTARRREDGRISFFGHDQAGSTMIKEMGKRLALSGKELGLAESLVRGHMRPLQLAGCKPLSQRAVFRFFRDLGKNAPDVLILSLADHAAKCRFREAPGEREQFRNFIFELLRRYFFKRHEVWPAPLLSGREICEVFPIIKGGQIRWWLEKLAEAQVEGIVKNREAALNFIRKNL